MSDVTDLPQDAGQSSEPGAGQGKRRIKYRYRYRVRKQPQTRLFKWPRRATYAVGAAVAVLVGAFLFFHRPADPAKALERAKTYRAKGENAAAVIELNNVLAARSNDHEAFYLVGQALADMGDLAPAEGALRRALEKGHRADETLPLLGRVLLEAEKFSQLTRLLGDEVQAGNAVAPDLAILRGRAYLGLQDFVQAETQFRLAYSMRRSSAAQLGLAQVAIAEQDRAAAERIVAEVLQSEPANAAALTLRAQLLGADGRLDEAAQALQKALAAQPEDRLALRALAVLELSRDNPAAARPLMFRLQKVAPRGPDIRYVRAMLAFKEKRLDDARAELKRLAEIIPDHPPGLLLVGLVQHEDSRYDQAQNAFGAYLKRFPGDVAALRMLGATLLAKGQPHLAANIFAPYVANTRDVGLLAIAAEANRQAGRFGRARELMQRALAREPANADLKRILAMVDLGEGARDRAIAGLQGAIALNPADARADEALIMVLLAQRRTDEAEKVAVATVNRLPKSSHAYTLHGAVAIARGDYEAARRELERALELSPNNLDAVEALGQVDAAQSRPDSRRERLEAVIKRDPMHAGALLALAKLDLALGRHKESVASIRQSLASHPQSINALLMLADAQFRQGQVDEAVITARQARDLHPDDTRAIAMLAEALMAKGEKQIAIETLSQLTKKQPDAISGYLRLANAYLAAGDIVNARSTALTAVHKDPRDQGARALLADIYIQTGAVNDAIALAVKTQKEDPGSALGYRMEGDIHLARKDFPKATEAYRKAASLQLSGGQLVKIHQAQAAGGSANDNALRSWVNAHPDDTETRLYLADALIDAGRYTEAADHYKRVLTIVPASPHALNNLAWALHRAGDKTAIEPARKAATLAPQSAAALDTLGWILVEQGNAGEGVPALLKAVGLDADNPEIRYHLAQSMIRIGDTRRAKLELQTVLQSKRAFRQAPEARALAAKLGP